MSAKENCPKYTECGFIKFLNKIRETADSDCEKDPQKCGRLNPVVPIEITLEQAVTWDEVGVACPIIYTDEKGKPRRILKGTHQ